MIMKKLKIFLVIFMVLIIVAGVIIYFIDQNRMKNNKQVLFSTWGAKYTPAEQLSDKTNNKKNNKYVAIENLPKNYAVDQAIDDGCFVTGISLYNKDVLDNFIANVNSNNIADELRIVKFTVEGDLIIVNVNVTNDVIIVTTDNTRDRFSSDKDRTIVTEIYDKSESKLKLVERTVDNNTYIDLILELNLEENNSIKLCTYDKNSSVVEETNIFTAIILENHNNKLLEVKSLENKPFVKQGDKIHIHLDEKNDKIYEKETKIKITLTDDAIILESYPAQIPSGSIKNIEVIG